jgi:hypothetical protein
MKIALIKTENKFIRFSVNLVLLFLVVFLFDRIGGAILKHYYFSQTSGLGYRTTYSIDSTNADIVVFGSSRANHHYVPEVFEETLKMSFYNTGRDGNFLLYNYAVFKAILKRYTPKIIIMDINPDELYHNQDSFDRLSSLLPYYKNHPEIRDIIEMRSPYEKFKLFSALYPFNSSILTVGVGNLEMNKYRKGDRKGYVPLFSQMNDTVLITMDEKNNTVDSAKINIFYKIAQTCEINCIRLFFVQSPIFTINSLTYNYTILSNIVSIYNAEYIDLSTDTIFLNNPNYFQDRSHLNNKGATVFSCIIANYIKNQTFQNDVAAEIAK